MLDIIKRNKYLCIATVIGGFIGWIAAIADSGVKFRNDVTEIVTEMEKDLADHAE